MKLAVAAALCAALVLSAVLVVERRRPPDVRGSTTREFAPTQVPRTQHHARPGVTWPTYGFDARRLRAVGFALRPPFRLLWTFHGRALLEFPPAVANDTLYLPTFDGRLYSLDARTGRAKWRFVSGRCAWASPAVAFGLVYETFLSAGDCKTQRVQSGGELVALRLNGSAAWRRRLPPTESSPLVVDGLVVVGDWEGEVRAFDARSGRARWTTRTDGAVKGSVASDGIRLYVGDYAGRLYALAPRNGRVLWRSGAQSGLTGRGKLYATPAVAYGRVYLGSTDRKVYAFGARDGALLWSRSTGGYVYASAAVTRGLVLVGSYDRSFYALDAGSGEVRWRFAANGPISGAASIVGSIVYFSTFNRRTYALDVRTGRPVWSWPDGKYSPVVSDGRRIYLVGLGKLYGLVMRR